MQKVFKFKEEILNDKNIIEKLELLLPAGNLEKLKYALKSGADAVYAGLPYYSLRIKENKFKIDDLKKGIKLVKEKNKKIYLTVNIYPRKGFNEELFIKTIDEISYLEPDALIVADPGVIDLIKENFDIPIHLSVQANATNYLAVKFWKKIGVSRVILPRELILEEIEFIHEKVPDMELESFVHGSVCMAYSGRCLISAYLNKRHANLGQCTNSCRWNYRVWVEEPQRPGQLMLVEEDENGTYFFNAKDLCLIERLPELINAGVISFKVEGRNKTEYYVGVVARAYKIAMNYIKKSLENNDFNYEEYLKISERLLEELKTAPHRSWLRNFMNEKEDPFNQDYLWANTIQTHDYLAKAKFKYSDGKELIMEADVKSKINKNDLVEIISPNYNIIAKVEKIKLLKEDRKDKNNKYFEERELIGGGSKAILEFNIKEIKNIIGNSNPTNTKIDDLNLEQELESILIRKKSDRLIKNIYISKKYQKLAKNLQSL